LKLFEEIKKSVPLGLGKNLPAAVAVKKAI